MYQDPKTGGLGLVHLPFVEAPFSPDQVCFSAVDDELPFTYFVPYWAGLSFL